MTNFIDSGKYIAHKKIEVNLVLEISFSLQKYIKYHIYNKYISILQ